MGQSASTSKGVCGPAALHSTKLDDAYQVSWSASWNQHQVCHVCCVRKLASSGLRKTHQHCKGAGQAVPLAGSHHHVTILAPPLGQHLTAGKGMPSEHICLFLRLNLKIYVCNHIRYL